MFLDQIAFIIYYTNTNFTGQSGILYYPTITYLQNQIFNIDNRNVKSALTLNGVIPFLYFNFTFAYNYVNGVNGGNSTIIFWYG